MESDLDQIVERCASLLMSTDQDEVQAGIDLLNPLRVGETLGAERFSRLAQELAAYRGGIVLERLFPVLKQGYETESEDPEELEAYHALALVILSASKVVVERCLRPGGTGAESEIAERICAALTFQTVGKARRLLKSEISPDLSVFVIADSLECLVNFARSSKRFRDAMRDSLDQGSIFEHFKDLLNAGFLDSLSTPIAPLKIRLQVSSLAVCLAFSADSQVWSIDMGLLKLLAAVYEASPLQELSTQSQRRLAPALRCNKVLLRLLASDSATEKLRAQNALSAFRPHRRKTEAAEPGHNAWQFFEARLRGVTFKADTPQISAEHWRSVEDSCTGSVLAPVVCSWKGCAAGREPAGGTGFSKCGRCHVARYCSKEHQKLHWATHTVHCRDYRAEGTL